MFRETCQIIICSQLISLSCEARLLHIYIYMRIIIFNDDVNVGLSSNACYASYDTPSVYQARISSANIISRNVMNVILVQSCI